MKMNLDELIAKVEEDKYDDGVYVKTKVWVSEIKPSTGKKLGLLALEFKKFREGLQ